ATMNTENIGKGGESAAWRWDGFDLPGVLGADAPHRDGAYPVLPSGQFVGACLEVAAESPGRRQSEHPVFVRLRSLQVRENSVPIGEDREHLPNRKILLLWPAF